MSQPMQLVYTKVNAFEREQINLRDLMDNIPVEKVMEALRNEVFVLEGWEETGGKNQYLLKISDTLSMHVRYTDEGNIIISKEYDETVSGQESLTVEEIEQLKIKNMARFNGAFNRLLAKATECVLKMRIGESNITQTIRESNEVIIYPKITV